MTSLTSWHPAGKERALSTQTKDKYSGWVRVYVGPCPGGSVSGWVRVWVGSCLGGSVSGWVRVWVGQCLGGSVSG